MPSLNHSRAVPGSRLPGVCLCCLLLLNTIASAQTAPDLSAQDQAQQPMPSAVAAGRTGAGPSTGGESPLLQDAVFIYKTAAARGERLTQRDLARTLHGRGHRFPNQSLRSIARAIGLGPPAQQLPADGG